MCPSTPRSSTSSMVPFVSALQVVSMDSPPDAHLWSAPSEPGQNVWLRILARGFISEYPVHHDSGVSLMISLAFPLSRSLVHKFVSSSFFCYILVAQLFLIFVCKTKQTAHKQPWSFFKVASIQGHMLAWIRIRLLTNACNPRLCSALQEHV